jgi:hypothetical protein
LAGAYDIYEYEANKIEPNDKKDFLISTLRKYLIDYLPAVNVLYSTNNAK